MDVHESLDDSLVAWIEKQHMFWVATAPLAADGHVNCSPKGLDGFRVIDDRTVCYLDLTGSGAETIAHLRENARLTVMFHAFEGPARILRLHGEGVVVLPDDPAFAALAARFGERHGVRAIIRLDCTRVSTSCGYSVPKYDYKGQRETLTKWAKKEGPEALVEYRALKNQKSIDGLPSSDPS